MAQVRYIEPIDSMSGKLYKTAKLILKQWRTTKYNFTCKYVPSSVAPSVSQLNARTKFKSAVAEVKQIMLSDQLMAPYIDAFKKQTKYKTLRTFIFASVLPNQ